MNVSADNRIEELLEFFLLADYRIVLQAWAETDGNDHTIPISQWIIDDALRSLDCLFENRIGLDCGV